MMRCLLAALAALAVTMPGTAQARDTDDWFNQPSFNRGGGARPTPFWGSEPAVRASQRPRTQAPGASAKRGVVKGPKRLEGGGRPSISPQAPPIVAFGGSYGAGNIVIDTRTRALYYVLGGGRAYRYSIAVGREGFSWTGTQRVSRIAAWPDWRPPAEMRERDPRLPELMTGGINNPLGSKAIYLGNTLYRIHGTNNAASIGSASSSGCFRMTNANVEHLARLVSVGARVTVLRNLPRNVAGNVRNGGGA